MKYMKHLLRFGLFLTILIILLLLISKVLNNHQASGIEIEQENSMGYLVVGDSEAYTSIAPMDIWKEKGFTGYNLGVPSQTMQKGLSTLENALEYQKPRVLLLETNFFFRNTDVINGVEYSITNLMSKYFSVFKDHTNWKSLLNARFLPNAYNKELRPKYLKGYQYNDVVKPYTQGNYVKETQNRASIQPAQRNVIDQILELAKENNIQVIFYTSASPKNWTYSQHNIISDIANEYNIKYVDFNLLTEQLGIDWQKDTYDKGDHLNYYGAQKTTRYMAQFLDENTSLEAVKDASIVDQWNQEYDTVSQSITSTATN